MAKPDFPLINSIFLAVALYTGTTVLVDWPKVYKGCVLNRNNLGIRFYRKLLFSRDGFPDFINDLTTSQARRGWEGPTGDCVSPLPPAASPPPPASPLLLPIPQSPPAPLPTHTHSCHLSLGAVACNLQALSSTRLRSSFGKSCWRNHLCSQGAPPLVLCSN